MVNFWISLAPLAVIFPLLGAASTFALIRHETLQRIISISALGATLCLEITMMVTVWFTGPVSVNLGKWLPPFGITMVVDQFSALMLVVSSIIYISVLVYAIGQGSDDEKSHSEAIFHPTYLILAAGISNAFLAGDLFNLYVGFEILLTASYVLLTLGGTGERIRAAITYVLVSVVSSVLFLVAIAMIYAATGTLNMADVAVKLSSLPEGTQNTLHVLLLVAFGIKAAVFPLSFWLPDSYPTAPAPVTAVFAGLLTKVGVYAIARTETLFFPHSNFSDTLMIAAFLTMVIGILGAVAQTDIKRMLSFTLVSHVGYMIFGIALSGRLGLSAAIFYAAHHITVQTTLFMAVGLIEWRTDTTSIERMGGLLKLSPAIALLFFIPAFNLSGIPPFSGFLGKLGLLQAGVSFGTPLSYVLVVGGVVTTLLTLLAVARLWNRVFWRPLKDVEDPTPALQDSSRAKLPRFMVLPTGILAAIGVSFTLVAGGMFEMTDRAAASMQDRSQYIRAVLGDSGVQQLREREKRFQQGNSSDDARKIMQQPPSDDGGQKKEVVP